MHGNLVIGCLTMSVCLAIQCFVLALLLHILVRMKENQTIKPGFIWFALVLIVVMLILLAGNILQMTVWAALFLAFNEFQDFTTAFYHSVVNFATLGYGDIVMSEKRRLLGALEATNGVLMFGLSTGFLYAVLSTFMQRALKRRAGEGADAGGE